MRCMIIDDEQPAINVLTRFIKKVPGLELVESTTEPLLGLALIKTKKPDIIFLDIEMDQMDGIELAKAIGKTTRIIFCTGFEGYAVQSYELNAVDYLLKPIEFPRFRIAVQKAMDTITGIPTPIEPIEDDYIMVKQGERGRLQKVDVDDIVYVQAMNNYISFFCPPQKILAYLSLKELEERLPPANFIRVHKSFMVAIKYIREIDHNEILLKKEGIRIPIGANYKEAFMQRMLRKQV